MNDFKQCCHFSKQCGKLDFQWFRALGNAVELMRSPSGCVIHARSRGLLKISSGARCEESRDVCAIAARGAFNLPLEPGRKLLSSCSEKRRIIFACRKLSQVDPPVLSSIRAALIRHRRLIAARALQRSAHSPRRRKPRPFY